MLVFAKDRVACRAKGRMARMPRSAIADTNPAALIREICVAFFCALLLLAGLAEARHRSEMPRGGAIFQAAKISASESASPDGRALSAFARATQLCLDGALEGEAPWHSSASGQCGDCLIPPFFTPPSLLSASNVAARIPPPAPAKNETIIAASCLPPGARAPPRAA